MSYADHIKAKNKVCFLYEGHNSEYLVQLRMLYPHVKKEFPRTEFICACRKIYADYLMDVVPSMELETFYPIRLDYGFCYEIIYDASHKLHPMLKLFNESNAPKFATGKSKGHIAYISAFGDFPNDSLTSEQIQKAEDFAKSKGFKTILVNDKKSASEFRDMVSGAAYVVGVANELFYEAVAVGTPTALIPTGAQSEDTYKSFTQSPKVLPENRK